MQIKVCDRCGKQVEPIKDTEYSKDYWRYDVTFDAHPYPKENRDLCQDCKKSLYFWMWGLNKHETK